MPHVGNEDSGKRKIQPDILLPLLADQWLKMIDEVVTSRGSAAAPFQIDSAGETRRFETIIRELEDQGNPSKRAERVAPTLEKTESKVPQLAAHLLQRMDLALHKLTSDAERHGRDLAVAVREITQVAAESLNATRAGIWVANDDKTSYACADHFSLADNSHTQGPGLSIQKYPSYFASLESQRVIDASVARRDPRTYELSEEHLKPKNICSRLDAPIRHHGKLMGFISVEQADACRAWVPEEISFVGSLADLMSLIAESGKRQKAEDAVRYSNSILKAAFNSTNEGIIIVNRDGVVSGTNQKFLDLWKIPGEALANKAVSQVLPLFVDQVAEPEEFTRSVQKLFTQSDLETVELVECKDGRVFERTSKPQRLGQEIIGRVCCYRDLTSQRQSEAASKNLATMLQQAQKLEALGTLAGGIAHDFNNILTAILGHAELALSQSSEPRVQQSLDEIFKASDRAKHLVKQILTFCRKKTTERKTQPLRPVLKEVVELLSSTISHDIEIRTEFDPSPISACYDAPQLHQVVMNLCTNAVHAMKGKGGIIRVGESRLDVTEATAVKYPDLKVGPYAHLWVADNGTGMDPETASHVFEPFFTTKKEGEGTGLGLSVVHGIIQTHEGAITVDTKLGVGTTFHIYLPILKTEEKSEEQPTRRAATHGNGERILYVDDDQAIGNFVRQALEMLDYQVDVFEHPTNALEHFSKQSYDYDLIITDLGLPRLNGVELATRIQKIAPGIPVILLSGSHESVPFPSLAKGGIRRVVTKPVSCKDLSTVVRDVLDMNRPESDQDR
jgi:signal transduction histidine kinase/CheY-like chemotaxis protein